jgi:hypothetical protein
MVGLKIIGLIAGGPTPFDGEWLSEYDPDRDSTEPTTGAPMVAHVRTTPDPAKALAFESAVDAMNEWKRVSKSAPVRPDGQPNRPLTAFTVEVSPLPSGGGREPHASA